MTNHATLNGSAQAYDMPTNAWIIATDKAVAEFERYGDLEIEPAKLRRARDLVAQGRVLIHDDGTAAVTSGTKAYEIIDRCTCDDAMHRGKWCKHYIAMELMKVAQFRYQAAAEVQQPAAPTPATEQPGWHCAQAPSSCTMKWQTGGVELLLTLRDETDHALFERISHVLPRIQDKISLEKERRTKEGEARKAAAAEASTTEPQPQATTQPPAEERTPESTIVDKDDTRYCELHDVDMSKRSKGGRSWHSHYDTEDSKWCSGT